MAKLMFVDAHGEVSSATRIGGGPSLRVVPPLRAGHAWTEQEDEKLSWRFQMGVSIEDLALVHQRSCGAIRTELKRLGLLARR